MLTEEDVPAIPVFLKGMRPFATAEESCFPCLASFQALTCGLHL